MMKYFFAVIAFVFLASLTSQAQVQLSRSSEPAPMRDLATGEVIIMPVIIRHDAPKLAAADDATIKMARLRNRAQLRTLKADSTRNGYYPSMGNRDWGTSMRMNHYLFLPPSVATSGQ